jgi:hypothetical protein
MLTTKLVTDVKNDLSFTSSPPHTFSLGRVLKILLSTKNVTLILLSFETRHSAGYKVRSIFLGDDAV